ncbi:MAG: hypothetical protein KGI49_02505, partial [Patescibacteria group bacterium]|nr:hypothetical protein [Patescibacteria group bacterium]
HLEQKVAEQTADVRRAYEVEKRARAELEDLNRKKDIFITQTQHNLRTPLTSIKWALETLRSGKAGQADAGSGRAIAEAEAAAKNMSEVVENFIGITEKE